MSKMRGVSPFNELWERRTTVKTPDFEINVMNVGDLINSKKTQRAKDWPMIQRLVEVRYLTSNEGEVDLEEIRFWLRELRTVEMIVEVAQRYETESLKIAVERPLLIPAIAGDAKSVREELTKEIEAEKEADRIFWEPLRARLGELRRAAKGN